MSIHQTDSLTSDRARSRVHQHVHELDPGRANERRTRAVAILTAVTMVVEVTAGLATGSMALLADGLHMGTHMAALGISVFAYAFARRNAANARYSFGIGKVPALAGFTSALVLAAVALATAWESISRLVAPHPIAIEEAMVIAVAGLVVNLVSLLMLAGGGHDHGHGHSHGHSHAHDHAHALGHRNAHDEHDGHHRHAVGPDAKHETESRWQRLMGQGGDQNIRGAVLHVAADALTSVLAIAALGGALLAGWHWLDPLVGLVGVVLIAAWSWSLTRDTSRILLDAAVDPREVEAIRQAIESQGDTKVVDLHLWHIGPQQLAAIVSVASHLPYDAAHYKGLLASRPELGHVTIEILRCDGAHGETCPEGIGKAAAT